MKIEQIELYNFGSYEEVNTFDFSAKSNEQRIVVIGGKNGAGKTTLFTALQIGLYGYAAFGYKIAGKRYLREIYRLINNRAKLNEEKSAYIKVNFSENGINRDLYEIARSWSWCNGSLTESLMVYRNSVLLGEEEVFDFQNYLFHLIPPELLKLYFFDGEKIADYFLENSHEKIKDALLILSGNDTYEILYKSIRRILNNSNINEEPGVEAYAQQKETLTQYWKEESEIKIELAQVVSEIEHMESELSRENRQYEENGGISLEEWKRLQCEIKKEEEERDKLNSELKTAAAEVLPFLIVKHIFPCIREQIDVEKKIQVHKILQDSLSTPQFKRYLSSIVKKTSSQSPSSDTQLLLKSIQTFFDKSEEQSQNILFRLSDDQSTLILSFITEIERYDVGWFKACREKILVSIQKSKELREILQKSTIENYEDYLRRCSEITKKIDHLHLRMIQLQNELSDVQEKIISGEKAVVSSKKALEAILKKRSLVDLSDRMLLLVEDLQREQYIRLITSVERDLNIKFKQLIRKGDFVDYIHLDQDFSLHLVRNQKVELNALKSIIGSHGVPALKRSISKIAYAALLDLLSVEEDDLEDALDKYPEEKLTLPIEIDYNQFSNGEKQILVMSLYWAIMNQGQNELPFIIDTPFARIDTEHRTRITEMFFKDLRGQLIILSTNEELRQDHISAMTHQVSKIYMLEYGEDKRTHIVEGNYFEVVE